MEYCAELPVKSAHGCTSEWVDRWRTDEWVSLKELIGVCQVERSRNPLDWRRVHEEQNASGL